MEKAKQRMWKENGRWKGWKSSDYRRRVTWAKKGELVHHKDHNKANNSTGNFKVEKPWSWMNAIGKHNRDHPEKSVAWWRARARQRKNGK
jgi:hypothetical protein